MKRTQEKLVGIRACNLCNHMDVPEKFIEPSTAGTGSRLVCPKCGARNNGTIEHGFVTEKQLAAALASGK